MKPNILIALFAVASFTYGSALSDAAASMKAGEWRELSSYDLNKTFGYTNGSNGASTNYSEDMVWNPIGHRLYFLGSDHFYSGSSEYPRFIEYSETTNTWIARPRPSWFKSYPSADGEYAMHGYDHSALDPATGNLYHRSFSNRRTIHQYLPASNFWRAAGNIPSTFSDQELACCIGIEFFPEYPGLVFVDGKAGKVFAWSSKTGQWREFATGLVMGGYSNFAEYNPVHRVVVGGGGYSSALYKIDSTGKVTALKNAPINLGILESVFSVDPVTGDYLVLSKDGRFYVYDLVSDTWTLKSGSVPASTNHGGNMVVCVVASPISTYGVTAYVSCDPGSNCRMILYKHAQPSRVEKASGQGRTHLTVSPNPARGAVTVSNIPIGGTLRVLDLKGRRVAGPFALSHGEFRWDAAGATAGVYLLNIRTSEGDICKPVYIVR